MNRKIIKQVKGFETKDGAGVKLVRVLGHDTVEDFDPILMLDSFDSENPSDYIAGFPDHPHRGIETISYVYKGKMTHKDSLGNEDTISSGQVQWMTAGSGIIHSESLPPTDRLLGVQLWLNLPKEDKMAKPHYLAIKNEDIKEIEIDGGKVRLLAGSYKDYQGYKSSYLPLDYYDIHLEKGKTIDLDVDNEASICLFTLVGKIEVSSQEVDEKTCVKLGQGDKIKISALEDSQILYISSKKLGEEVAWGGPIVMNTKEELNQAFLDLRNGNFIREEAKY